MENLVIISPSEASASEARAKDLSMPAIVGETTLMTPENKELPGSHGDNNGVGLPKSISCPSTVELENALLSPGDYPADRIVELSSLDDDHLTCVLSPEDNNHQLTAMARKKNQIDTASPFDSVKAAVSKFGGIVDWKAHRAVTVERRKIIEQELVKTQEEIPAYKKLSMDAEEAKLRLLKELDSATRQIEELKLNLEKAQKEEEQARQDAELAKLRVAEMEQGITDEGGIAAKAQLEVTRARHAAAVSELETVNVELEQLKRDYSLLVAEKELFKKKAEAAVAVSKETEMSLEDLTVELIAARESLESAHNAHLEAEEHRIGAVMAKEQDVLNWEEDLKHMEEDLETVMQQIVASKDLKSKLDTATALLQELKSELATYMESKIEIDIATEGDSQDVSIERRKGTRADIEATLYTAKNELQEVNLNIQKATDKVNTLMVEAAPLKSTLEKEKAELASLQQREGMASIAVASLEAELNKTNSEIALARAKETEQWERMVELPKELQVVAQEADQAKKLAAVASDELRKAKEEAEQAKAGASTMQSRLHAALKEIEASKASENVALATINATTESKTSTQHNDTKDSASGITLSLEEYHDLSKRVQEAEEQANIRVASALSQIEVAKESELKSMNKLEKANREMAARQKALQIALQKSEKAEKGKLGAEQELRTWRAENMQTRKVGASSSPPVITSNKSPKVSFEDGLETRSSGSQLSPSAKYYTPRSYASTTVSETAAEVTVPKKKKKSNFIPKIFSFLTKRKKSRGSKS